MSAWTSNGDRDWRAEWFSCTIDDDYARECELRWSAFCIQWVCIAWCMLVGAD